MARRILVTGGAGFIGSHTVDLLVARGDSVRVLDALLPPVHAAATWPSYLSAHVERIHGSVEDPATLRAALHEIDVVVHLAAYQDYLPNFSRFFHVNAGGTALLYELLVAEAALRDRVERIVVATSQAVLGEGRYECPVHGTRFPGQRPLAQLEARDWDPRCDDCGSAMATRPTFADDPPRPHNQYGISKLTQELIALNLGARYGIPTVAMRYSITQGPPAEFHEPVLWRAPYLRAAGASRAPTDGVRRRPATPRFRDGLGRRASQPDCDRRPTFRLQGSQCRGWSRDHCSGLRPSREPRARLSGHPRVAWPVPRWRHAPHLLGYLHPGRPWVAAEAHA